ncbi:MAG: hypothetical protein HFG87_00905 [Dorea sp.]|nr:hypothetical protein [Dorea sp.]
MLKRRTMAYRWGIYAAGAVLLALVSGIYAFWLEGCADASKSGDMLFYLRRAGVSKKVWLLAVLLFVMFIMYEHYGTRLTEFLYTWRFAIAAGMFVLCVACELNGSSIGAWQAYLGGTDTGTLLGAARPIRSDEWAVSTPMMLSQYRNAGGAFPYYSDTVRGAVTDMFMVYGQPVKDIAMIFKPFYWGYLFLPAGMGLAFFWYGRWIALFLVSFEMCMLLTGGDKRLSAAGSFLVALAPVVQWWFAINGLVEMLVFGQLAVLLLRKYMTDTRTSVRMACVSVIAVCAGGFILILYPAWQIPMAYVILALGIWVIIENYRGFRISARDILCIVIVLAAFAGIMLHVWGNSKETVELVLNTAYPGKRMETGGGIGLEFFNYVSNIWYALLGEGTGANVCESAQFIDFFPLCYVIPLYALIQKRDKLIALLLCVDVFFVIWCVAGFPAVIAKATLMSFSTASRAFVLLGFVNILLLIRGLALAEYRCKAVIGGAAAVIAGYAVVNCASFINEDYYPRMSYYIFTVVLWILLFYLLLRYHEAGNRKRFSMLCIAVMIFAGALVNPVRRGVDNIYETETIQAIEEVHGQDPEALWAVEGVGFPCINMGIMAGAPTVNSTNVYPNLDRWEILDQKGTNEKVYNRYAHISIVLKESGSPEFLLNQPDVFTVSLTGSSLKQLGVTYLMSGRESLREYESEKIKFIKIKNVGNYSIYRIE